MSYLLFGAQSTDEEMEAQRGYVVCGSSHRLQAIEAKVRPEPLS